ncbi:MAG: 23S rRNA (adenine(2503)-C(2))-methyltransferase RlmN [Christensenellales bacterium]|jgi:23S rRNA (adenine2503-C2)-methyltransferase
MILASHTPEELSAYMVSLGEKPFRAMQVFEWIYKGAAFAGMENIPKSLREKLTEHALETGVGIHKKWVSQLDGTVKYLFKLHDGHMVEGVLMRYSYGNTLCVSSQVGCRMGCRFCASTLEGLARNLQAGEMAGQVISAGDDIGRGAQRRAVTNVVIMGSGEPLENYDETIRFIRLIGHEKGLGISPRNISLSTCGLTEGIRRLSKEGLPITLSISLHAPNDRLREQIMPVARTYSVREVMDAAREYVLNTKRRIVIEYALIDGLNDSVECAQELAGLLRSLQCHVNLIPLNAVEACGFRASGDQAVKRFLAELEGLHISATVRRRMGADIEGACGQLRRRHLNDGL